LDAKFSTSFTQLKPTTRSVTLGLPETLLARLKNAANQRDVPYQSLIKIWLAEKLDESEVRRVPIHRPRVQPSIAVFTHPATLRAALLDRDRGRSSLIGPLPHHPACGSAPGGWNR